MSRNDMEFERFHEASLIGLLTVALAALRHDALEDQGDIINRSNIKRLFAEKVLDLVDCFTGTPIEYTSCTKPSWHERKIAYTEHIRKF